LQIEYKSNVPLDPEDVIRVFEASRIRRPTKDTARVERMLRNANLTVSAWAEGRLVGVCRALTDFAYCCYLSDLAVDPSVQRSGIGKEMIAVVRRAIGEEVALILLSAPETMEYYPKVGFEKIENGYIIKRAR
jgi:N-acetylglutamate synthase-like GNAT family acetyltransferase